MDLKHLIAAIGSETTRQELSARSGNRQRIWVAAFFIGLCTVEGQFITPTLVGRSMVVNPLLVFLILIAGIWIWGPVGGIVAIPLLLWVRVMTTGKSGGVAPAAVAAR